MSKIFSGDTFGLENISRQPNESDDDDDDEPTQLSIPNMPTAHSKDAVDYSDFDEAIPDEQEKYYRRGMGMVQKNLPRSRLALVTDNYDSDEEEQEDIKQEPMELDLPEVSVAKPSTTSQTTTMDVQHIFPGFEKNKILKFSELFMTKIKRPPRLSAQKRSK